MIEGIFGNKNEYGVPGIPKKNKSVPFSQKPGQLKSKHPELYEELYSFYRVNPIEWE